MATSPTTTIDRPKKTRLCRQIRRKKATGSRKRRERGKETTEGNRETANVDTARLRGENGSSCRGKSPAPPAWSAVHHPSSSPARPSPPPPLSVAGHPSTSLTTWGASMAPPRSAKRARLERERERERRRPRCERWSS
ncbi:hypothetical protein GW17_00044880 [Ensete ventricosum]|nr:hypothetical protein GW17_00044880 [Ensete ventricosum]